MKKCVDSCDSGWRFVEHGGIKECVDVCPEDLNYFCNETIIFENASALIRYEIGQCIEMCPKSNIDAQFPEYAEKQTNDYLCVHACDDSFTFEVNTVKYLMYNETEI